MKLKDKPPQEIITFILEYGKLREDNGFWKGIIIGLLLAVIWYLSMVIITGVFF